MSEHNRKIKRNRSKKALQKKRDARINRIKTVVNTLGLILFTTCLSLMFIGCYGWITRCDYFGAKFIIVSGADRLNQEAVLKQAGIYNGINIIQVNITEAREKLSSHPWISNAEVIRQFPDRILLRIEEHKAAVVFDLGKKYLVNTRGEIFKKYEAEFASLPVVRGVSPDSVIIAGIRGESKPDRLLQSVMELIRIENKRGSLVSGGKIIEITADPEIGISVLIDGPVNKIKLGFGNYDQKLKRLAETLDVINKKVNMSGIDTIDLNDINSVVIKPATT